MFKPLLAPQQDPLSYPNYFKELRYPLLCSPKLDGIRCIIKNGVAYSRTGKPLPSNQVQSWFTSELLNHFDGEVIYSNITVEDVYNKTQSLVMSENKIGSLSYYVFDYTHPDWLGKAFSSRLLELSSLIYDYKLNEINAHPVELIDNVTIENYNELIEYEERVLREGFEGVMLRDPFAPYKQGRGTFKEGIIYKLKRFKDDEAVIIGFKERMINENTLKRDELGYAKRSSSKEGLTPGGTLGAFIVYFEGQELEIAPGKFSHEDCKDIWENQELFKGALLKFRYFLHGIKDKPRFPRAIGIRDKEDI